VPELFSRSKHDLHQAPQRAGLMPATSNPFDDPGLAARYEGWYEGSGRSADLQEKRLLAGLLTNFPEATTVLEVGCGTGHFTRWLAEQGYRVTGLDCSEAMLTEARRRNGIPYIRGDAMALPLADHRFDLTALITTLEFVSDPREALQEAMRVSAQGLLLGVLNRRSRLARKRKHAGRPPWDKAQFFSVAELKRLVRDVGEGRVESIRWRTTLWPFRLRGSLPLPWGGFIGMAVRLR
jgi:SAM-dependent methyltransferase